MKVRGWGVFSRKFKSLTFFFSLSSSGSSSRTPSDKPVAHVVGKSSDDVSWNLEG